MTPFQMAIALMAHYEGRSPAEVAGWLQEGHDEAASYLQWAEQYHAELVSLPPTLDALRALRAETDGIDPIPPHLVNQCLEASTWTT